uniref:Uncharacterized protein n=1 Tax=Arundo donax TaxID=35708 RepID=A0A0A9GJS9_ARUDO
MADLYVVLLKILKEVYVYIKASESYAKHIIIMQVLRMIFNTKYMIVDNFEFEFSNMLW